MVVVLPPEDVLVDAEPVAPEPACPPEDELGNSTVPPQPRKIRARRDVR